MGGFTPITYKRVTTGTAGLIRVRHIRVRKTPGPLKNGFQLWSGWIPRNLARARVFRFVTTQLFQFSFLGYVLFPYLNAQMNL